MSITKNDTIFKFYKPGEHAPYKDVAYYGWQGDMLSSFWAYFSGFELASKSLQKDFIDGDHSFKDYIVYPLFFNYRHMTELLIKFLYIKYSNCNEQELKNFIDNGHKLCKCWNDVKPHLQPLLDRQMSKYDLESVDYYINEIENQDPLSFNMRYPINKKLEIVHSSSKRLDVINFSDKMNSFVRYIKDIDCDIDNQLIGYRYDIDIQKKIINIYLNSTIHIDNYLSYLKDVDIEQVSKSHVHNYSEVAKDTIKQIEVLQKGEDVHMNILKTMPSLTLELLFLLYYTGRELYGGLIKLTKIENEIFKDFITLMMCQMDDLSINLDGKGKKSSELIDKLWSARPDISIQFLNISLRYFNYMPNK